MMPPEIRTPRLILRRFCDADHAAYLAIRSEPEVARALGHAPEDAAEKTQWFLEHDERMWRERGFGAWLVCDAANGRALGHAGLWFVESFGAVEILYAFTRSAWGRGLATEAGGAITAVAFGELGLTRLIALATPQNAGSRRVIEKLGFRTVGLAEHRGFEVILHELSNQAPRSKRALNAAR